MSGGVSIPKPHLSDVTLVCVDTSEKSYLGARAIDASLKHCSFGAVKMLTDDLTLPNAVSIRTLNGLEDYSRFMIRELHQYVQTSHCLVVQWDGYVLNGAAWTNEFLKFDYLGSPWFHWGGKVGNGGFSIRSKKLMNLCSTMAPHESGHPEDAFICHAYRDALEHMGVRFAPTQLAARFGFEGRSYSGQEWSSDGRGYSGAFGFHSFLSQLPNNQDHPMVYHHSGDVGDVIYSLAVAKALGGGTYFLSPHCKYPFPKAPKACALDPSTFCSNVGPLMRKQPYIWNAQATGTTPLSVDCDFNEFRIAYRRGGAENWKSLLQLHAQAFGVEVDGSDPWLECNDPIVIPDRPIVVNKTARYNNHDFPWWDLVRKYGHQMVFIGTPMEHQLFQGYAPDIPIAYHATANLWEAARVIQGSKCFIGNQSANMAIALGLGKNIIQEVWLENPNCKLVGDNRIFWERGPLEVPESWLK